MMIRFSGTLISADQDLMFITSCRSGSSDLKSKKISNDQELIQLDPYRRRVVSLSKTLYSPKVLVNYPGSGGSVPT